MIREMTKWLKEVKDRIRLAPLGPYERGDKFTLYLNDLDLAIKIIERQQDYIEEMAYCECGELALCKNANHQKARAVLADVEKLLNQGEMK